MRECNTREAFHEGLFLPREQKRKRSKTVLPHSTVSDLADLLRHGASGELKLDHGKEKESGSQESSVL